MEFNEPVEPDKFKDLNLLDSAVNRPYQTWAGDDLYPSIYEKAAALFHSISCNHCFYNGNKRTAVATVDDFLTANEIFLLISNEDMYELAKNTAAANENGIRPDVVHQTIRQKLEAESVSREHLEAFNAQNPGHETIARVIEKLPEWTARVRNHPMNADSN